MTRYMTLMLLVCLSFSCQQNDPQTFIAHLEGYWEISEVQKEGTPIKNYKVSTQVDYFMVQEDLSGFRKKVAPTLNGNYMVTQHESPFQLNIVDNRLEIQYNLEANSFSETIIFASETELIIENDAATRFIYKPYTPINLDYE